LSSSGIIVYGTYWCPDCHRAKKFLSEQAIDHQWIDIEQDPAAEAHVMHLNNGKRIIPTVLFPDNSFLVEPSNAELARKLGLQTEARFAYYDLIVIGGGPAGLTAAIYATREGVETLVIERSSLGGQAGISGTIDNFPGFPEGLTGQDFAARLAQQSRRFGAEILQAVDVAGLHNDVSCRCVQDDHGRHYHAGAVLVATGATYRRLNVPGEADYIGAGVHFCATCDGPFYKGSQDLVVVGGGNSACEEALHLTKFTDQVTLLVRGEALSASRIVADKVLETGSHVNVRFQTVVEAFEGRNRKLTTVKIRDLKTGAIEELHPAAAFLFIGQQPNSAFVKDIMQLDPYNYILTGYDMLHLSKPSEAAYAGRPPFAFETSSPGFFAAGDVRHGSTNQIAAAVGEGAAAALSIRDYLKTI
jgi:thioredoxin reductase (NADPH)